MRLRDLAHRMGDSRVAQGPDGPRFLGELLRRASGLAARIPAGSRWIIGCEDAWTFTCCLVGLAQAGATALIPSGFQPEVLEGLASQADGCLRGLEELPEGPDRPWREGAQVGFWTSGSTGDPKLCLRPLEALEQEAELLEATFGGPDLQDAHVAGTVPHHHIYGCLFRIIWPLLAGRPFDLESCGTPDRFQAALAEGSTVMVSTPAHLQRLPDLLDLAHLPCRPLRLFSSGAPLAHGDALTWRQWHPQGVLEVYGSTESGGIAWRVQGEGPDSDRWTPFADVHMDLEGDGALRITSPRAGVLRLEDRAQCLPDGTFRLLGRLDRIVKLEAKRIALPELEAHLRTHPEVREAALVLLEGPRPMLGAVVVPAAPRAERDPALAQALRQHLAQRFDAIALPRRWRFREALPADERGKVTARSLTACFAPEVP